MLIKETIKLTCPYCGKRGESRIDKTYDNYDKKIHTTIICSFCHRQTEMVELDCNEFVEFMKEKENNNG